MKVLAWSCPLETPQKWPGNRRNNGNSLSMHFVIHFMSLQVKSTAVSGEVDSAVLLGAQSNRALAGSLWARPILRAEYLRHRNELDRSWVLCPDFLEGSRAETAMLRPLKYRYARSGCFWWNCHGALPDLFSAL